MDETSAGNEGICDHELSSPCFPGGSGLGNVMARARQSSGLMANKGCESCPGTYIPHTDMHAERAASHSFLKLLDVLVENLVIGPILAGNQQLFCVLGIGPHSEDKGDQHGFQVSAPCHMQLTDPWLP